MDFNIEEKALLPNPFDSKIDPMVPHESLIHEDTTCQQTNQKPNFPFFFPIIYHNIKNDIPQKYSNAVRFGYYGFCSFSLNLLISFLSQCFSGFIQSYLIVPWREIIMSLFTLLIAPLTLFYCQYYPIYISARDNERNTALVPIQFFVIFILFFLFIGVPGTGVIGIGYTIISFKYGGLVNKILSFVSTTWGFVNIVLQVKILFLILPIVS